MQAEAAKADFHLGWRVTCHDDQNKSPSVIAFGNDCNRPFDPPNKVHILRYQNGILGMPYFVLDCTATVCQMDNTFFWYLGSYPTENPPPNQDFMGFHKWPRNPGFWIDYP